MLAEWSEHPERTHGWSCFSRLNGKGLDGSSGDFFVALPLRRCGLRVDAALKPRICAPRILCARHTLECEHTLTRCRSYRSQVTAGSLRQWRRPQMSNRNNELRCAAATSRSNTRAPLISWMLSIHPCSARSMPPPLRRRCRRHQYHRRCGRCRRHRRRRRYRRRCCAAIATAQPSPRTPHRRRRLCRQT